MYTTLHARARTRNAHIPKRMCMCRRVFACVYICVCARDATASPYRFFCRCNCAICYMLDEAIYICIDATGLHILYTLLGCL